MVSRGCAGPFCRGGFWVAVANSRAHSCGRVLFLTGWFEEPECRVGRHGQVKPEVVLGGLSCPPLDWGWAGLVRHRVASGVVADRDAEPTWLLGLAEVALSWGLTLESRFSGRSGRFECGSVVLWVPSISFTISTSRRWRGCDSGVTYFSIEVFRQCSDQRRYGLGTGLTCVGRVNAGFLGARVMGSLDGTPIWRAR